MQLPPPGSIFVDRYELKTELGRGGYAVVYLAEDRLVTRDVAIKILSPRDATDGPDGDQVARFEREARVLAGLQDPHTITMFDFGTTPDGLRYLVSEFVDGTDLDGLLARTGPLPENVVVHIAHQVVQSLREAHGVGLLHRDLKPANILVFRYSDDPYRVKVLDFGLAKSIEILPDDDGDKLTRTGFVMGTPGYMSPEQIRGEQLGPPSDLYAVGLLMYELVSARKAVPDGATLVAMLKEQLSRPNFPIPEDVAVSPWLRNLVARLTAKDPAARPQTAEELLAELEGALDRDGYSVPLAPRPVSQPRSAAPSASRSAPVASVTQPAPAQDAALNAVIVILGLLISAGLVFAVLSALGNDDPEPDPRAAAAGDPLAKTLGAAGPADEQAIQIVPIDAGAEPGFDRPAPEVVIEERKRPDGVPGCSDSLPFNGEKEFSLRIAETTREWITYLPSTYDPGTPHPVVIALDSSVNTGDAVYAEFKKYADEEEFVIIAPLSNDAMKPWRRDEDPAFIREAVARTSKTVCIDPTRMYGVGEGFGAQLLVRHVVCELPLAAYAASTHYASPDEFCKLENPIPFMHISGESDPYHPIEGGKGCSGTDELPLTSRERWWRGRNKCSGPRREYSRTPTGSCHYWECDDAPVVSCIVDGGREWPTGGRNLFQRPSCLSQPSRYPYGLAIWKFFQKEGRRADQR